MENRKIQLEERKTFRPGTGKELILWENGLSISGCEKHDVVNKVSDIASFFEGHIKSNNISKLTLFELGSGGLWGTTNICRHLLDNCNLDKVDIIISDPGYSEHLFGWYDLTSREFPIDHRQSTIAVFNGDNDIIKASFEEFTSNHQIKVNIRGADETFHFRDVCRFKQKSFHGFHDEQLTWPEHRHNLVTFMREMLKYRKSRTSVTLNVCGRLTDEELFDWEGVPEVFPTLNQPLFYFDIHMHYRLSILMTNYLRDYTQGNVVIANAFDRRTNFMFNLTKRFFRFSKPWKIMPR